MRSKDVTTRQDVIVRTGSSLRALLAFPFWVLSVTAFLLPVHALTGQTPAAQPAHKGADQTGTAPATTAPPTTRGQVANPSPAALADRKRDAAQALQAEEAKEAASAPSSAGVLLDRVVAVVNGEVVLESDVEEERRLAVLQPVSSPDGEFTRDKAVERLVNRRLLLQQSKLQPQQPITEADIDKQIEQLRREVPVCKALQCETSAGWAKFLAAHQLTSNEVRSHWRERMEALRFIEVRFRSGIRIPQGEIKSYYDKTMLPQYARQKVKAPPLDALSDRIQEVLLQQQVSGLLQDWLKSLRAQGTVQIVQDGTDPA